MELRKIIEMELGINKKYIPSFQSIGSISLVKFPRKSRIPLSTKKKIATLILRKMPNIKTICEIYGVFGELRKPKIRFLGGMKNHETIHRENGISYCIDVSKLMFSKGNLFEKQRIVHKIRAGETIVDMFSGIGYFSLGIAKFSNPEKIISIEKNPVSFKYLKKNIILNKISKVYAIKGDCRKVSKNSEYQGIADRILMGYLPKTWKFLPAAFSFAKPHCIVHYHDTFFEKDLWKGPDSILKDAAKKFGFDIKIIERRKVKSFAPKVWHVVIDFEIKK